MRLYARNMKISMFVPAAVLIAALVFSAFSLTSATAESHDEHGIQESSAPAVEPSRN